MSYPNIPPCAFMNEMYLDEIAEAGGDSEAMDDPRLDWGVVKEIAVGAGDGDGKVGLYGVGDDDVSGDAADVVRGEFKESRTGADKLAGVVIAKGPVVVVVAVAVAVE